MQASKQKAVTLKDRNNISSQTYQQKKSEHNVNTSALSSTARYEIKLATDGKPLHSNTISLSEGLERGYSFKKQVGEIMSQIQHGRDDKLLNDIYRQRQDTDNQKVSPGVD